MAGDPCGARTSDGTSGFRRGEAFGRSDGEEGGCREVEDTLEGAGVEKRESAAGLGRVRGDGAEVDMEEDGEEVEHGGAKEERKGVTAEEEEDLEMGNLGAEEEDFALEDIILPSKWWLW